MKTVASAFVAASSSESPKWRACQPAWRARDQVDDLRRVGGDHAGARRFLRPVVEIELDVRLRLEVEAETRKRVHANRDRALPGVDALERRQPAEVGDVEGARHLLALGAEQPFEPALPQAGVDALGS